MAGNYWEQDSAIVAPPQGGGVVRRPTNPFKPAEERRAEEAAAREAERLRLAQEAAGASNVGQRLTNLKTQQQIADEARDREGLANAAQQKRLSQQFQTDIILKNIKEAKEIIGEGGVTGWGALMSSLPESRARRLRNILDTIKSNLTFDKLQQIRDQSKTGGAVGNASDNDMRLLGATVGSLDQGQKDTDVINVLDDVQSNYLNILADNEGMDRKKYTAEYLAKVNAPDFSRAGSGAPPKSILSPGAKVSSAQEKQIAAAINEALKAGASQDALNALSETLTGQPLNDYANEQLGRYFKGEVAMPNFVPTQTTDPSAIQGAVTSAAQTAPGAALGAYANAALGGFPQLVSGDAPFDAMRAGSPKASFGGDVLGGFTGTMLPAAGAMKLGLSAPRAATAANLAYGTLFGANTSEGDRMKGAATGAGASLVGDTVGKYALAPLATKAMDTAPVQAAASGIRRMFGRGPVAVPRPIDVGEAAVGDEAAPRIDDILSRLDEAAKLNLPFSLADADPALRQQLGSASRLSPDVRSAVGGQLQDRALGQADRALSGVNRSLVPPVSMSAESDALRKAAQDAAKEHYERAYQQPALTTPELEGLLKRPSLKDAMGRANRIISEEGGNAQTLGFGLDATGAPVLNPIPANELAGLGKAHADLAAAQDALKRANASLAPGNVSGLQRSVDEAAARLDAAKTTMSDAPSVGSLSTMPAYNWKALDYSKRGLDDVVEGYRDPLTRRLNLDEGGRAVDRTRTQYRTALGSLNDDYRQGLDAYSSVIKGRDALNNGYSVADTGTNMDQFGQALGAIQPEDVTRFKQGYSTALSDRINKSRLSANPYDIVAGTPDQQAKLTALYPDAPNFLRQRELEKQMAETAREVTGGSPTQERALADQRFTGSGPNMGDVAEIGASFATGLPPVGVATRAVAGGAKGMFGRRAQQRAAERAQVAAPMLYNPDPAASAASIKALIDDIMSRRKYQDAIKAGSSLIAGGGAAGAAGGY